MKRFSKQVLALVLSVCLLLGVFPALPASAGEETESGITRAQLAVSVYNWFLPTASGNAVSFSDIENCTEEQKAAILTLAKAGIVEGTAENTFSPGGTVTRAQAAVVLYRAMGGTSGSTVADSIFDDIGSLHEDFKDAINYLVNQNVLQASDATEGAFVPEGSITQDTLDTWLSRISVEGHFTRADLAVMVCDAFDLTATGDASFNDISDLDKNVRDAILTLANLGIVSGTADSAGKSFDPQGLVSRMATAVTIYRVYQKRTTVGDNIPEQALFTDVTQNVMPAAFNLLVFKGVLSGEDIVYSTGEDRGLFLLNAMANRTTVQGWLNKAAAELNPAQGHTVTVNVTGGSETVSYTVNWYQNGEKLQAGGTKITVTDTSVPLYYEVVLDNDALKQYSMTNGSGAVKFNEGNNTEITVTLADYQKVSVNGTVQNEEGASISGATVTITQHYSASVSEPLTSVTTNASGEFTYSNVKTVPSVLKISAQGYYDYSTAVSFSGESSTAIDLGTVQLSPLPDSKVTLSLSFQAAAGSGQKTTTTSLSSFANLKFTVHKGDSEVTDFAAQYPYLVFDKDSGVSGGDTLTISVTDASGKAAMLGGAVEVKLNSDGSGLAELTLVENGKIAINALTGVDQATVMVFNNGGDLVVSGAAWGAYTSPSLPSGRYTVVALEKTDLIQSVSSLSQLSELGLASNNYVQTTATVSNGVITEIDSLTVPELDESAISFTDFASTTVDYVTAAVGRNVTLRVEYQLKEQYENSPVSLTITLPDGLSFKGAPTLNSAVVSSYGNGNTYTISGTGSGVVRVFLTGSTAGSYDISPKLSIDGPTKPVGTAHLEITDAQIYVPSTTGKLEPTVSGISAAEGNVIIYVDGEAQQDTTVTADKTGAWKTTLSLSDTAYSQHEVYAQIHKDGYIYTTETKTLIYDPDYIDVSKVTMYNVVDDREQEVVFDYNNPYSGSNYFTANDSEFTFVIEFESEEDCSRLANVRLNLFTANGDVYTESAERMEGTNKYTVVTSGVIPVNVGVEYLCLPAEDPTSPEGFLEYDWTEGQIPQGISSVMEIQRVSEWEDAVALWIGLKQEDSEVDEADDSLFPILIHRLDYSDYKNRSEAEMKSEGFAKVEKTGIFGDNGKEETVTGYHRVVLSDEAVQHVVVLFPDGSEGSEDDGVAVAITIPIDFREIIEGLEEEEEALAALAAEVGIEGAGITFATQELSLLSGDTQNLAQVIPFPYQDDTLSEAALNWRKLSSMAQDRNNTGNLAYFPAIADLMFLEGQVAGERIQIWEEIEYERERIRQLAKAESCYGLPLMTQEEVNELWNQLTKIVELEQGVYEYREAALDLYTKRILAAGMADFATGLERRMEEKVEEVETAFYDGLYELLEDAASWVVAKVVGSAKTAKKLVNLCVKGIEFYDNVTESSENFIDALEKAEELVNQFVEEGKIYGELDGRPYWEETRKNYADLGKLVKRLDDDINEKVKENRKNCPPEPLPNHQDDPAKSPCPDKIYGIDPSGYVYEAVPSNRLKGVTAEILQKNGGSYTKWNEAEQYGGQSSTITTTETGEYRWDVPEGTWKVEFTKDGYTKAEKDSLVVPPPQTDINIGMVSEAAPEVSAVQAYTDGVLVEFSQYMNIGSVKGSITLVMGGKTVSCTVEPVNAEADTNKDTPPIYASRFFVKPNSGTTLSGEVIVTVFNSAKNYNGTTIETEYSKQQQVKGVCPTGIEAPGSLSVLVGDSSSLSFTLQPGLAGEELEVEITSPSLVGFADNQASSTPYSATTDANGSANVTLKGLLPGAGLVKITHAESGLSTTVKIKIVSTQEQLNAPGTVVAKLANGTTVTDGMTVSKGAQVVLSGSPAGVTIQYTLDGTCPKTTGAKTYTGPIIINQDTTLRAVAKGSDGVFGEVSTWKLKVSGSGSVSGGGTSDKEPESLLPFGDVSEKAWYYSAIEYVYEHDLMAGTSATTFEPNATLSRAMVAQILYNLEGQPTVEGESAFTDTNTHWAATAITWAQKTGVVSGYENNTFRPNKAVTREELAQMLYNYAKYKEYNLTAKGDLTVFPDGSKVSSWAETAMAWANGNRLINGFEDNTLRPGGDSTRAQAASILMNFDLNLVEE